MAELLLILRFVLAALLYGFLGLVFYLIWRDLKAHSQEDARPFSPATLRAEAGAMPNRQFSLRPVTAIGRDRDNHLVIDDPFTSAHHAMIVWRENQWWIEDLNSHNGTFLNEERISTPHTLMSGDRIAIGETILRFETEDAV